MSFRGHYWTIVPRVKSWIVAPRAPEARPWSTIVRDPVRGDVPLTGHFSDASGAERLVVLVHGLGGSADSHYVRLAASEVVRAGFAALRLNLRGADRSGLDYYHGGLTADLHAALASVEFARFQKIHVLGFSLGGHVTLRLATEATDPRLASVAALCAPLDLSAGRRELDRPRALVYRTHLLNGLKEIYAGVAARTTVPTPLDEVMKIRTLFEWDQKTVCPRFSFRDPEHYYATVSMVHALDRIRIPSLYVGAPDDPIVPYSTVAPTLERRPNLLDLHWAPTGGHVGFPESMHWPDGVAKSVDRMMVEWLRAH